MNENTAVVVNGIAITPQITEVLSHWFGTVGHPGIDRNLFDILSTIKSMRQEFEKLIPKKGAQS